MHIVYDLSFKVLVSHFERAARTSVESFIRLTRSAAGLFHALSRRRGVSCAGTSSVGPNNVRIACVRLPSDRVAPRVGQHWEVVRAIGRVRQSPNFEVRANAERGGNDDSGRRSAHAWLPKRCCRIDELVRFARARDFSA